MFRLFEIRDGKFTTLPDIRAKRFKDFILGSIIVLFISSLSIWFKIDERQLWKIYNAIIQHFGLGDDGPRIDSEAERDARVELEVDRAIANYEIEEQKYIKINMKNKNILEEINKPKYDKLQKIIVQNAVYYEFADGTMGIRGSWVTPDPREIPLE